MSEVVEGQPPPIGGAEYTAADILPLLEYAMQRTMSIPCDCVQQDELCPGDCVGSRIWMSIHRARKLIRAETDPLVEAGKNLSPAPIETAAQSADLVTGFVLRPEAASFLREIAKMLNATVDGKRLKLTVDVRWEK